MTSARLNLLDLSFEDLMQRVVEWGEPRFRATQLWRWLYSSLVTEISEMANLPKELRTRLEQDSYVGSLKPVTTLVSEDQLSDKVLFETTDGQLIETVLMRYTARNSVCVSCQVGCPVGCAICATGQRGFVRNLTVGEIAAQVLHFARKLRVDNAHVTNVVFMGMGEPMLNFDAVWPAILNLNDREGLALGARRFTISTAGVVPGIERLARESLEVGLAVSLHSPDNALRDKLVPVNRRYPLERLLPATRLYSERTGRRVTFEYALIKGLNDSDGHALRTATLLRNLRCYVNLIPLNPVPGCEYESSSPETVLRFQQILVKERIQTTVRLRRGVEIAAGCGQLRGQQLDANEQ
jgi:23S rRNA (adenine2503-C2)-methyltransferase